MPNSQRIEFITRHFNDLQTIRFAPVAIALLLVPMAKPSFPHISRSAAWISLISLIAVAGGFYWWISAAIRRRCGSVKQSREQIHRQQPLGVKLVRASLILWILSYPFLRETSFSDVYIPLYILAEMLARSLDRTNPSIRRIAWTIGLMILFGGGPFLIGVDGGAAIFSLAGGVWLSLGVFDFLLLRRTFAEITAGNSPDSFPEGMVHYG